jgi:GNAT superfamily N-acetyltransferase
MRIDRATARDTIVIAILIGEIEAQYGGDSIRADEQQVRSALFTDRPAATVLLARNEIGAVVGMASYSRLWPATGATAGLYLNELYVRPKARRQGVARALLTRLRDIAAETGCTRLEWTADTDNPAALALYKAFGAEPHRGKLFYRITTS